MKTPLNCLHTPLFQILSYPPSPCSLLPTTPSSLLFLLSCYLSFCCLSAVLFLLNGWLHHIWWAILLNDILAQHMSILGTLVSEGPWCVFYAIRHQIYCMAWCTMCFFAGTLIWYHTLKHTQHTQGSVDWHTHINIYLHYYLFTMCSQQLSLLHIFIMIYLLIRCCKTRFFL